MNCLDAREQFPAVVAGRSSLSEWAPVEAHVAQCVDCRKILETLYRMKPRNEPGWARPLPKPVERPDESTNILEVVSPSRRPQRHALWAVLVAAAVTLGAGAWLAGYGSRQSIESSLVALLERVRSGIHQLEVLVAPAPPIISAPPAAPTRNSAPETATAPPPSPPAGARQAAVPTAPARPLVSTRPESSPRKSPPETTGAPPPPPPVVAPEPKAIRPTKGVPAPAPASLPSRVSKSPRSIPDKNAAVTKPTPEAPPEPSALVETGKIDVAVQLSVSNRKDAERDLGMLLARVGGTKLGPGQTSTLTASVPRSSYSEFTRGLSQIGSWRLEAGRASLPDPIHVAVTLAK
jgi:hypothetical protein